MIWHIVIIVKNVVSINMKITLIATVLNEEDSIEVFLKSVLAQTKKPYEIIIVDGGSFDETTEIISNFKLQASNFKLEVKKGNRSVGRNFAIKKATGDIIAVSDAGCVLRKDWLELIVQPFSDQSIDVVSGFYRPITRTIFQKALAAYTSVMPDKLNDSFNPSSRSVAFRKSAWKSVGGYPEYLDTCEDMVFVRNLRKKNKKFFLQQKALVYWRQKENLVQAFWQFFGYALGDGQALYIRPNTIFLFVRYLVGLILVLLGYYFGSSWFVLVLLLLVLYLIWSIGKNYRYVKNWRALYLLPALQFTSDIAVLTGTTLGLVKKFLY